MSRYLQDETRFDKWGAQGKSMCVLEVLREEGMSVGTCRLEKLTNSVFPRTFLPVAQSTMNPSLISSLISYYAEQSSDFSKQAIDPGLAIEETATRFQITPDKVREILGNFI